MDEASAIRVVVIDDHEMILQSMVRLLRDDPQIVVVGTALTAEQGFASPRGDGRTSSSSTTPCRTWTRPMRSRSCGRGHPEVKIITFSGSDRPGALYASMRAGSSGWVNKTRAIQELRNAVLNVAAGRPVSNEEMESLPQIDQLGAALSAHSGARDGTDRRLRGSGPVATPGAGTPPPGRVLANGGGDRLYRRDRPVGLGTGGRLSCATGSRRSHRASRLFMSVNMSVMDLSDPGLFESISGIIQTRRHRTGRSGR